jgi:transcriptional regulator with XRE-family HTH domain
MLEVEPQERFGMNLRRLRKRAGLTQMELANRAGMDMAEISKLELGKRDPRLSTVVRMAIALDVAVERLIRGVASSA